MEINNENPSQLVVIMVPFPCHSHLNQLLHLSCLISSYNIPVHYACSATHIHQVRLRFNSMSKLEIAPINFHELTTPPYLSPPPNRNSTTKFPSHLQPSFDSFLHLRHPLAEIFEKISATAKRVVIIHDTLMSYAVQDAATIPNVESYDFIPIAALACFSNRRERGGNPSDGENSLEGLPSSEGCYSPEFAKLVFIQVVSALKFNAGSIINSCRSIEGTYIDLIEKEEGHGSKPVWAIGPLNMENVSGNRKLKSQHICLEWLDKQAPNSVIYVSFGTTVSLKDEEIKELALGLEQSGQKFIWVLRDADKGNIFEGNDKGVQLPKGYEERVKDIGIVVRDWAPQLEILEHTSTGGFMTHCGWNSCLESITMGVPIAAWPMHSDQPKNAFLVTDVLKIGLVVNKWENRDELVTSSVIAKVVKLLIASKEGEDVRKRVEELGGAAQRAVKEGGVSLMELDSFIARIKRE